MPSIVAKFIGDATEYDKTVSASQKKIAGFKSALGQIGLTVGLTAVLGWFKTLISQGAHLADVSDKLGVSTEFMQTFSYAAEQNGVSVTTAEMALQRFTRRLGEAAQGKGELLPILKQYNVAIKDSAGVTRSAEAVMKDLADIIKATPGSTEKLRIAFKAFDSEGAALVNLMQQGGGAIDAFGAKARRLGLIIDEETVRSMQNLQGKIDTFLLSIKTNGTQSLGGFIGLMEDAGTKWAEMFMGSEEGRISKQFEDMAKRALEVDTTLERVRRGRRTYIKDGQTLIPIQQAIADKAKELREHEEALNEQMKEKVASAHIAAQQKLDEAAAAKALEQTNKQIGEFIFASADAMANKFLPAQERLLVVTRQINALSESVNDQDARESDRMAAAKQLVALMKQQQTLVVEIGKDAEKALAQDKKKTAELEKQKQTLKDQQTALEAQLATQQAQYRQYEDNRFQATFDDIIGGLGGGARQRDAEEIQELRDLVRYQSARGFSEENQNRTRDLLTAAETEFTQQTGIQTNENPFKLALEDTETELKTMNEQLKTL